MDRSVTLVDAGYLLAEGGKLTCGTGRRSGLSVDHAGLIASLQALGRARHGVVPFRTYWYDAATDGIPTVEHLDLARLPDVKVRLGRLSGGRQKGVDSLMLRDLMVLAINRIVVAAVLVTGDEDLREAVVFAQDLGVRATLVGVDGAGRSNQADTLIREADEHLVLGRSQLAPYFSRIHAPKAPGGTSEIERTEVVVASAERFAGEWAVRATEAERLELLGREPEIPPMLDRELVRVVEASAGDVRDHPELRVLARRTFWAALRGRPADPLSEDLA